LAEFLIALTRAFGKERTKLLFRHVLRKPEFSERFLVRWIEFPNSVLLFAIVSGNPQSVRNLLARPKDRDPPIDFDDEEFGGYHVQQFESLL